jgi:SRSO17 transposase
MIQRALDGGAPARWVAADEVYGNAPALRALLERRGIGYVLEVARHHRVPIGSGLCRPVDLAATVPASTWQRLSAGAGSKGQRWYAWALVDVEHPDRRGHHGLLIRRHVRNGELAFYHTWSPSPIPLAALVAVAGSRWRIEENIQAGKGLAALDDHQVRRWTSWHRWTVMAMLAHAFLAVTAAADRAHHKGTELIALTCNEIRHLFAATSRPRHGIQHLLHWSRWRRRHQARARASHYQRQAASGNDHDLRL